MPVPEGAGPVPVYVEVEVALGRLEGELEGVGLGVREVVGEAVRELVEEGEGAMDPPACQLVGVGVPVPVADAAGQSTAAGQLLWGHGMHLSRVLWPERALYVEAGQGMLAAAHPPGQ